MSILITGMEMPAEGWHKVIKIFDDGTVVSNYDSVELGKAVSVPPHGDLIDRDALIDWIYSDEPNAWKAPFRLCTADRSDAKFLLKQAPTIIPAEEGE